MVCNKTIEIGISRTAEGDYLLPLFADETGTWSLFIDDVAHTFEATDGEMMVVPDEFTDTAFNTFQIKRPDNTIFNNCCYLAYVEWVDLTLE